MKQFCSVVPEEIDPKWKKSEYAGTKVGVHTPPKRVQNMHFLEPIFFWTDILGNLQVFVLHGNHVDCKVWAQEFFLSKIFYDTVFTKKNWKCVVFDFL